MTDDYSGYSIKQLREALSDADINALADAGLLDEDTLTYLLTFEDAYEPESLPHHETGDPAWHPENTELWHSMVRRETSKNLRKAVKNGNQQIIEFALGFRNRDETEMDFVDYERLRQVLTEPAMMLFLFGSMGAGKTYTAFRLAELWHMLTAGHVLTNVRSVAEKSEWVNYVSGYEDVVRYCIEHPDQRKLLVADELSSLMSGYAGDRDAVETLMRPLTRKMRKRPFKMSLIGIGHRPQADIHPTLRNGEMAKFGFKPGRTKEEQRKRLALFDALDGEGGDEDAKILEVGGIKATNLAVDTDESGAWEWPSEDEALNLGYDLKELTGDDFLGLIHRFEEDEEEDDAGSSDCPATTKDGNPCPGAAKEKYGGYCWNHRKEAED